MGQGGLFGESARPMVVAVLGGAILVAGAVAAVFFQDTMPDAGAPDAPASEAVSSVAPAEAEAPQDPVAADQADAGDEAVEPDAAASGSVPVLPAPPAFDQIRVAPDGATVVAGTAPPDATVTLLLDGADVAVTVANGAGAFAAILTLEPSSDPRILSLRADLADGSSVDGLESVIVAPFGLEPDAQDAPLIAGAEEAPQDADGADEEVAEVAPPETPPDTGEDTSEETLAEVTPETPQENATGSDDIAALDTGVESTPGEQVDVQDTSGAAQDETATPPAVSADAAEPETPSDATELAAVDTAPQTPGASASAEESPAPVPAADDDGAIASAAASETPEPAPSDTATAVTAPPPTASRDAADASVATGPATTSDSPALVVAGPEGVRVIRDGSPEVQTDVQIDAITYSTEGEVTLSGSGRADAGLRISLNNEVIEMGEIGPDGQWSMELPGVDPGTYTLSVAQLDSEGSVETVVDTPFLREDPARLARNPMLVESGVGVITVQPGFTLWGIAEANFGDGIAYVQIFEENRADIRDPDLIFPGQIFQLPDLPRGTEAP